MVFNELLESNQILELLSKSLKDLLKSRSDDGLFGSVSPTTFNMSEMQSSSPVIEYVIRPHVNVLISLSAFIYHDYFPDQVSSIITKNEALKAVEQGLEWLCDCHITGNKNVDQFLKQHRWGRNWRSGLWAALTGFCSFLVKESISEDLKKQVNRVIAFEANRFIDVLPPDGCEGYSRVEENAQDTVILAWAINSMPEHDNIQLWKKALNIWAINIATDITDHTNHCRFMDKSVAFWTNTTTLYPDMTTESHGFFNLETLSYTSWIVLAMACFKIHGNEIPEVFSRKNHQKTYDILFRFCLPNGILFSPGGSDLPLFIPRPLVLAWGLWHSDPKALKVTSNILNWMQEKLKNRWVEGLPNSNDGWNLYFKSQPAMELALLSILPFPKEQKFYSMGQIENAVDTRKLYPYVEVAYRRNIRTTRSIAWKAMGKHPMISLNIHSFPELLVPMTANLLGIPRSTPSVNNWEVAYHEEQIKKHGFDSFGLINYYNSKGQKIMHREIRALVWGDDGILIFDRIVANTDISLQDQYLSPIYLVNDIWTGNKLKLHSGSLTDSIYSQSIDRRPINCPSFWLSIEDRFLFQFIWKKSKGLTYIPGNTKNAPSYWKNCVIDTIGTHVDKNTFSKEEVIYETGFFIGSGKSPRPFKSAGIAKDFFKGLVIMDGKETVGLD